MGDELRAAGSYNRADLREDEMINPAPVFLVDFRPLGASVAPGTAPARKIAQFAPKFSPGDQF